MGYSSDYPSSIKLFMKWYRSVTGSTASYQTAFTWSAFDLMEAALHKAAKDPAGVVGGYVSPERVFLNLQDAQASTPAGRVIFDPYGVNTPAASIFVQQLVVGDTAEIVAPSGEATATFVYPMPTWDERLYEWHLMGSNAEVKCVVIASLCSGVLVVMAVTAWVYRRGGLMNVRTMPVLHPHELCAIYSMVLIMNH